MMCHMLENSIKVLETIFGVKLRLERVLQGTCLQKLIFKSKFLEL